ncbi:hypothetical protein EXIGLDRAFT_776527 [Exidia glandulosa HHB12029]|uniref:Uncharacterized protein n=1 Tax=Exidia glandulosa HHB12029 TaxID=1314781 RepID=A0A165DG02_EXIGL|nr:hypothetical protein EXIGLDRAFT_776527 [Exidia glandulosa HHB12029]
MNGTFTRYFLSPVQYLAHHFFCRNVEKERRSALQRWRTRQDSVPAARVRAREAPPLLPKTETLLGSHLEVSSTVALNRLVDALTQDLQDWNIPRKTREIFEYCTTRLIAQEERDKLTPQLSNLLTRKLDLLTTIEEVARNGVGEAWRRSPMRRNIDSDEYLDEYLDLGNLADKVANLASALNELLLLWNAGAGYIKSGYDDGTLLWQSL